MSKRDLEPAAMALREALILSTSAIVLTSEALSHFDTQSCETIIRSDSKTKA